MGVSALCFALCCVFVVFVSVGVFRCPCCFLHWNVICHVNFGVCACAMETSESYTFGMRV